MLGINLNNLKLNLLSFRYASLSFRIFKFPRRNFSPACCAHVAFLFPLPHPLSCCFIHEWNFGALFSRMRTARRVEIEIETECDWTRSILSILARKFIRKAARIQSETTVAVWSSSRAPVPCRAVPLPAVPSSKQSSNRLQIPYRRRRQKKIKKRNQRTKIAHKFQI